MLRWAEKPKKSFRVFFSWMLETAINDLTEDLSEIKQNPKKAYKKLDLNSNLYYDITDMFTIKQLLDIVKSLKSAHESKKLFMPTDYHFLIIDRLLQVYQPYLVDMVHDYVITNEPFIKRNSNTLKYDVEMDYILGRYFWDDDYDLDPRIINRPDIIASLDVSEEAVHACNRMRPQPHEIELKEWVDTKVNEK
jgi:hypothetical protein